VGIKNGHANQRSLSVSRLEQSSSAIQARGVTTCSRFLIANISDMHMVYFANDVHFRLIDMGQKELGREYSAQQGRRERDIIPAIHATFFLCGLIIVLDPTKNDKSKWIRLADRVARRR
jgi:hypothetical protein